MRKFEKEFRQRYPETVGETDMDFDNSNYAEFLEEELVKFISSKQVVSGSLPERCLSKEDGVCRLPIATCVQCNVGNNR